MNIIKYQLYLLQIENYEIHRYFALLFKKGYFKPIIPSRKSLIWTKKITLVLALALLFLVLGAYLALNISLLFGIIWIIVSIFCLPFYYALAVYLTLPFDLSAKHYLISKAKKIVADFPDLKIIGIAGSYGKTTLKYILYEILSQKYHVSMPPGNVNTAVGLSSWAIKNGLQDTNILLVEFGEEYPGDNKRIANIFPQDATIITGINEAHFERMGNIEKTASTIFEALEYSKQNIKVYMNGDDENVINYHKKYLEGKSSAVYDSDGCDSINVLSKSFNQQSLRWEVEYSNIGRLQINCLAEYVISDVSAASAVANDLGLSADDVRAGIENFRPVEHRLQPIVNEASGVLVIDDSYNGNPTGAREAINTLALFQQRRKLYLTPGLVETGRHTKQIHEEIGEQLSNVADIVILVKNSATPHIAEGLIMSGFDKEKIVWFETAQDAHAGLGNILKSGDVILFQNDWGDQYL